MKIGIRSGNSDVSLDLHPGARAVVNMPSSSRTSQPAEGVDVRGDREIESIEENQTLG